MKMRIIPLILEFTFILGGLFGFAENPQSGGENSAPAIDSLITVQVIGDRVVIVKLGFDAVTAINTRKGIVVIDAGISNRLTAKYRKTIEEAFGCKDFAYLINTHSHSDHTGGNQVFSDAGIIAHENCKAEMAAGTNREKSISGLQKIVDEYTPKLNELPSDSPEWNETYIQRLLYQSALDDWQTDRKVTFPTRTFADSLCLDMGDVHFELCWFGRAHSGSDILIHIPELKVLMTGDLFFPYGRPSLRDFDASDTKQWEVAVVWLKRRLSGIDLVIGGHGQLMGRDDLVSFLEIMERKRKEINKFEN